MASTPNLVVRTGNCIGEIGMISCIERYDMRELKARCRKTWL